jgi:hypothetical protein
VPFSSKALDIVYIVYNNNHNISFDHTEIQLSENKQRYNCMSGENVEILENTKYQDDHTNISQHLKETLEKLVVNDQMVYTAEGVRYKCTQCPRLLKKMAHVVHFKSSFVFKFIFTYFAFKWFHTSMYAYMLDKLNFR